MIGPGTARPLGGRRGRSLPWRPAERRDPVDLEALAPEWIPCDGPMPAAAALRAAGRWDLDHPRDFDADDWWYRCRFAAPDAGDTSSTSLRGPGHRGGRLAQRDAHPALGEHVRRDCD